MPDTKISDLPSASVVNDADIIPIVQAGVTKKAAKSLFGGGVVDGQQIFDGSHVLSFDGGARKLYGPDGTSTQLEWDSPNEIDFFDGAMSLTASDGFNSVPLSAIPNIKDDGFTICMLPNIRQLIANDGSTVALDWSDPASPCKIVAMPSSSGSPGNGDGALYYDPVTKAVFIDL